MVVLPLEPLSKKPAKLYPGITSITEDIPGHPDIKRTVLTCGPDGQEVFQFEQVHTEQKKFKSDGAKLKISTQNTALAIVDGQHRAMALLALYRNLKGDWNQLNRQAYRHYYQVWPESLIKKFDTKEIQLPVMICTFPDLNKDYNGDFDVIRAARRIFLTLNKNARKVSDSRNKLLDDQDMVSECLRETLSLIKNADTRSSTSLRIYNVELDQEGDKQILTNPLAITGVSHLYYICERILFLSDRISGLTTKTSRMGARRHPTTLLHRLQLNDYLSQDERESTRRDNYVDKVAQAVENRWRETFGPLIVRFLSEFYPLRIHENASLQIHSRLERDVGEGALRALLFDGQGTAHVLERFETQLNENIKDDEKNWKTPEILVTKATIENLNARRSEIKGDLRKVRAELYFENFRGQLKSKLRRDGEICKRMESFVTDIVTQVSSSIAFQTALIYTLIDMAEGCSVSLDENIISEYIDNLNNFFNPTIDSRLSKFVSVMSGSLIESIGELDIAATTTSFREIVYTGDMQPDEWPEYRYLVLEIWNPSNPLLKTKIAEELEKLRNEINERVFDAEIKRYSEGSGKLLAALSSDELNNCRQRASERCRTFFGFF